MSAYLTAKVADKATDLAEPVIREAKNAGLVKRHHGYMVISVRDPYAGTGEVIFSKAWKDSKPWEHDYEFVATSKSQITWQTGLSSRQVQLMQPEMVPPGETIYYGSVIHGNIVVAYSGADAWIDEMIANIVLQLILGLIQTELEQQKAEGVTTYNEVVE